MLVIFTQEGIIVNVMTFADYVLVRKNSQQFGNY